MCARLSILRRATILLAALPLLSASPHDGDPTRLAELDARLARGADVGLLLERAELHRRQGSWSRSAADLDRVGRLAPRHPGLRLGRARLLIDTRLYRAALPLLDAELRGAPSSPEALELRSLAHAGLEAHLDAVRDLDALLQADTRPDLWLTRARLLQLASDAASAPVAQAHLERSWRGLEEGLRRLGPLPALELESLTVERRLGWTTRALARLDRLIAGASRTETWHRRRGDVLREAGRSVEARAAYRAGLAALHGLPPRHRGTPAMTELRRALHARLADLPPERTR